MSQKWTVSSQVSHETRFLFATPLRPTFVWDDIWNIEKCPLPTPFRCHVLLNNTLLPTLVLDDLQSLQHWHTDSLLQGSLRHAFLTVDLRKLPSSKI